MRKIREKNVQREEVKSMSKYEMENGEKQKLK